MNKTRVHKYIFLLTLLLTSITCFSQSTFKFYDDISIPQTDAWNFVRQGEVSPSMYTGTINLSVPIYEYKDKDFTIPITATYSSNGNMPNQIAGILGPGWNLEIGGSITIETNGIPDYGENVKHVQGFYTVHRNNPFTSHQTNKWWRFMFTLFDNGSGTGAPEILWVPGNIPTHNHEGELDAQPDIFHFRVPGHSGKFHLGFHGDVIFYDTPLNPSGYRLQIDTVPISNLPYEFSKFHEIILTTPDGYRYIFDGNPEHPNVDISKSGERSIYDIITAWHLTRMEAPDGRWASFQYSALTHSTFVPGSAMVDGGVTDTQHYTAPPIIAHYSATEIQNTDRIRRNDTRTAKLDQITFSDGSTIRLIYSVMDSSNGDQYKENPASSQIKGYANTIRLSDIYVTKAGNPDNVARASFTHARNTNGGQTNYLQSITVSGIGTYSFNYTGWNDASRPYPLQNTFSVDHWGYFNGKNNSAFYPATNVNTGAPNESTAGSIRNPDHNYAVLGMIEKITYPTGGYTTFEYEPHTYATAIVRKKDSDYYKNYSPHHVEAYGFAGGLRIKKISSFLSNGTPSLEKTYRYEDSRGKTSGILIWSPRYSIRFRCKAGAGLEEDSFYASSSLQDYGFTGIEYWCVQECLKDSTKTVNVFTSCADGKGFMDIRGAGPGVMERALTTAQLPVEWVMYPLGSSTINDVHFKVAPVTSFQSQRGMLKERIVFKNDTTKSASVIETTSFKLDTTSFTELPCYLVRMFSTYRIFTGKHLPKETLTFTRDNSMETEKLSSKKFEYNIFWEVTRSKQTTPEGDTLIYEYTNLRDLEDNVIQASPVYSAMLRRNILTLPLDEKIYRKQAGQIQKTLISGKRCTYSLFPNGTDTLILPVLVETYDLNAQAWKNEAEILSYDQYGNITQLCDADNRTVSYLWSSDGLYLMLQAKGLTLTQVQQYITQGSISAQTGIPATQEASLRSAFKNAEITTIKYLCGVGPQKIRDAAGNTTEYTYTRWGKLKGTRRYKTAMSSENIDRNTYSNDNQ